MVLNSRAVSDEHKLERKKAILSAVDRLFASSDFKSVNMQQVAKEAGMAKGTVFFYFKTKEALFLAYARERIGLWLADLAKCFKVLVNSGRPVSQDRVVETFVASIAGKPAFVKLLALLGNLMENNTDVESSLAFKAFLRDRLLAAGSLLEKLLPQFSPGDGARFFLYAFLLVVGTHPMAEPAPAVKQAIKASGMEMFDMDLAGTLKDLMGMILRGWQK